MAAAINCAQRGVPVRVVFSGGWGSAAVVVPAAWFAQPLFASAFLAWVAWAHAESETAQHDPDVQVEDEYHPKTPCEAVCLVRTIVAPEQHEGWAGLAGLEGL